MTYGKFASAEELLKGYNQLEKSFTQKCQQLAALKAVLAESSTKNTDSGAINRNEHSATTADIQRELPIEKIENSNDETTSASAANLTETEPTSSTSMEMLGTEAHSAITAETDAVATATDSSPVALAESIDAHSQTADETQQELPFETANDETTSAAAQDLQIRANGTPQVGTHAVDTYAPKTLASARDAATKLLESSNATEHLQSHNAKSSDGTSVETPPSLAEQSTTVDSADTVPQSEIDAPVLVGHATATPTESQLQQYLLNNPKLAWQLLQQTSQPPQIMTGGGNVSLALPSRPKTIKEASLMAKQLFKN